MTVHLRSAHLTDTTRNSCPAHGPISLVLADDHRGVRRSMRRVLESEIDLQVVAEADDLLHAIEDVRKHRPQVLVLDLRMPNGSSIEAIRRLRHEAPATEIVVATMDDSPHFARQAIAAGAIGFVLKERADTELAPAVRCAARAHEYISPRVQRRSTHAV
jgi:two-component system, NarL family, response regulator NreC